MPFYGLADIDHAISKTRYNTYTCSGQSANYSSCYKIYIYVSQVFISRMPKMRVIPQLVSAPLSIVTLKILRLNHFSLCEITCGKYCPVTELRFTDILFRC